MSLIPLPAITTRLQAAMAALLLVLLAALGAGAYGYYAGQRHAAAAGELKLAEYRADVTNRYDQMQAKAEREKDALIKRGMALGSQLVTEREQHASVAADLKRRVAYVAHHAVAQPELSAADLAGPAADCRFSVAFVGVYNAAIGAGAASALPDPAGAGGAEQAPAAAEAADSGVRPADILYHLADYGQRCRDIESQLTGWIELGEVADGRD